MPGLPHTVRRFQQHDVESRALSCSTVLLRKERDLVIQYDEFALKQRQSMGTVCSKTLVPVRRVFSFTAMKASSRMICPATVAQNAVFSERLI